MVASPDTLHGPLHRWYAQARRDLPWRRATDPYRIWVSEVMLQQTRVDTVLRHYAGFLARFPDATALAGASPEEVRAQWSGLGYYRRARLLQQGAEVLVREHGGVLPRSLEAVLALPGVGRYTAGALLSFSYGLPVPVVDGNVARVLARLFEVDGDPGSAVVQRRLWALAEEALDASDPAGWNQALMELGALVCRPGKPDCPNCPIVSVCGARANGREDELPRPARRARVVSIDRVALGLVRPDGAVFLVQRPPEGLLASMWEVPAMEVGGGEDEESVVGTLRGRLGVDGSAGLGTVEHVFTHRVWRTVVHRRDVDGDHLGTDGRWLSPRSWQTVGLPTATRTILERLLGISAGGPVAGSAGRARGSSPDRTAPPRG